MNAIDPDPNQSLRKGYYTLLIVVGLGMVAGRILSVDAIDRRGQIEPLLKTQLEAKRAELATSGLKGDALADAVDNFKSRLALEAGIRRPFLSANDRSRWCAVRALVEPEMRVDGAPYAIDKVIDEPGWDTIDMVKANGHLYSSKPPILPTAMAAEYWLIYRATGMSLGSHPYTVGRLLLLTINGGCLLLYFFSLSRLIERFGTTDWGRLFAMACGVFGTFITTFAVTINNHLIAAAFAALLLEAMVRIWFDADRAWWTFFLAGLSSGLLTANELPAAAFSAAATVVLLAVCARRTLLAYLPAAVAVMLAFIATNWISVHSLKPAYMHRSGKDGDNWYDYSYERTVRNSAGQPVLEAGTGKVKKKTVPSYWLDPKGIDRGEPSAVKYSLHTLIGHHGIFSLTPIFLASILGGLLWLLGPGDAKKRALALWISAVTLVCMAFYIWGPADRNYGGVSSAFRWVFWFAPLWIVLLVPVADMGQSRRPLRILLLAMLAVSALSAAYPTWNPWTQPWIYDWMATNNWL